MKLALPDLRRNSVAVLLATAGLACAGISGRILGMINESPEFYVLYQFDKGDILLFLTLVVVGLPALLALLGWSFARFRLLGTVSLLLLWLLTTVTLTGAFRSVIDPTGGLLIIAASVVVAAALCYAFVRWDVIRVAFAATAFYIPIAYYSSAQAAGISPADLLPATTSSASGADPGARQRLPNVLVVVFDEFPLTTILRSDGLIDGRRFPNLRALADESYWFRQASSVSCNTPTAVPAIQSGKLFGFPEPKSVLPLIQYYRQNLFTLLAGDYDVSAWETLTQLCPANICGGETRKRLAIEPFVEHLTVAWLQATSPQGLEDVWPDLDAYWMEAAATQDAPPKHLGKNYSVRVAQFNEFTASIEKQDRPWLRFGHFLMPHSPFKNLAEGTLYYRGATTHAIDGYFWTEQAAHVRQSYFRHMEQAMYTDRLVGQLVARLRTIGEYDDTVIVIVSDHGVSFQLGDTRRRTNRNNFANLIGVPMILKDAWQEKGVLVDEAVQTIDILPTVLGRIGIDAGHPDFDGRDVLAPGHEALSTRLHYCTSKNYQEYPIDLLTPMLAAVGVRDRLFGDRPDGALEANFGPRPEWIGRSIDEVGTVIGWKGTAEIGGLVTEEGEELPAINLDGALRDVENPDKYYVVATVNGRIASVMPMVESDGKANIISSMLLPRLLAKGRNTVRMFVVGTGEQSTPSLHRLKIRNLAAGATVEELAFDL